MSIDARRLRSVLLLIAVLLVGVSGIAVAVESVSASDGGLVDRLSASAGYWLHVNDEQNLPSWYSSILFACVALQAAAVARIERHARRTPWWSWGILAAVFAYISFDEVSQVHDRIGWIADGLIVGSVVFALLMIPLLRRLPRADAVRFVIAGVVFVGGSAGMELIGTLVPAPNQFLIHAEEFAELAGATLLLAAIVSYARQDVRANSGPASAPAS